MGIYTAVCRANQLRYIPHLIISPHVNSPAAFGIIRRRIVLPDIGFNDNALAGTLMHEVTHCKRGDLYIKAAALFARSLHWFNPLVHLAAFRFEMEMELSCDESVLAGCSDETRAAYGESMLDIIRRCRRNRGALTTHFNPKKTAVKARLQNILYGSGKRRGTVLIVLCLVMCLIAGAIVALQVEADHTEQTEKGEEHTEKGSEEKVLTPYNRENTASRLDELEPWTEAVSPAKVLEYQLAGLGVTSDQYLYRTLLAIVTSDTEALEQVMGLPAGSGQIFTDISVTSCSVSRPENTGYFNPILLTLDIAESNSSVFPVGQSRWIVDEGYQGITLNNYSEAIRIDEPEQLTDAESAVQRWLALSGQVIHPLNREMTEDERSEFQRGATEYACRHTDGTLDSIREMVKLCFGSEEYYNKKVLNSDDGIHYGISGRGGARRSYDWIGETENADGSISVRILFYADVSKYIMAKTVEYTLRPVGEDLYGQTIWSFVSCTVLEDHGYPPYFCWA